jgi:hypothetical protein
VFSGAGTDHLAPEDARSLDDVIRAYEEQIAAVEKAGGRIILMASRALAKIGRNADDYAKVYNRVLSQLREPVIIHWLGDMFDPGLANYWGTQNLDEAMDVAVGVINANAPKVDGVKVSLLDKQREIDMRRRLDKNVKMYTGDDFKLCRTDRRRHQGFFPCAARHLRCHRAGGTPYAAVAAGRGRSRAGFHDVLEPTVPLSRHIFKAPTRFYKTGIGVHGLSQRPSGSFHHGRWAGKLALDTASRRTFSPCGQGGACSPIRACDAAHEDGTRYARHRKLMRDFSADHRWLSLNTATVRRQGDLAQIIDACARHGIRAVDPWRDQVATIGLDRGGARGARCRVGALWLLPRPACSRRTPGIASRCATTTAVPSMRPRRSARHVSCWWPADCRNIRGREAHLPGISGQPRAQVEDALAELNGLRSARAICLWRSSRCIRPNAADRACIQHHKTGRLIFATARLDPERKRRARRRARRLSHLVGSRAAACKIRPAPAAKVIGVLRQFHVLRLAGADPGHSHDRACNKRLPPQPRDRYQNLATRPSPLTERRSRGAELVSIFDRAIARDRAFFPTTGPVHR